jgi:alkane 1-monooxygenase
MREYFRAGGYLLVLLAPITLAAAVLLETPWLGLAVLLGGAPLLRTVFGEASGEQTDWSERTATFLEWLPLLAAVAVVGATVLFVVQMRQVTGDTGQWLGWGLSLWAVFIFASCIGHELLHRRDPLSRLIGRVLSGVIGYPLLEHEHRTHHGKPGNIAAAEWPRLDENVWQFSGRRFQQVFRSAWESDVVAAHRAGHRLAGGLPLAVASFVVTAGAFALSGGVGGFCLFIAVAVGVAWAQQAVTYLQHWGLGTDSLQGAAEGEFGWEDRCLAQAWMTLGISYHHAHHHSIAVPYYRQVPHNTAPRMPGGYVVMLVACVIPPLWRALMHPALEQWKAAPGAQLGPGRRLFCIVR